MKKGQMDYLVGLVIAGYKTAMTALTKVDESLVKINLQQSVGGVQAEIMVNREMIVVRIGFLESNFKYMGLNTSMFTPQEIEQSIALFVQSHIGLHELEVQAHSDDPHWDQEAWREPSLVGSRLREITPAGV